MTRSSRDAVALAAYLEERMGWRFDHRPGPRAHDCARFVDGGAKAATGRSPLKSFASRWTTPLGVARVMRRHGGMAAAVDTVMDRIAPTFAQRGDIGLTADGALVLFEGDLVVGVSAAGLIRAPRSAVVIAWDSASCRS